MWWNLILLLVSFIGLWLLSPKPKTEQQRASTINDVNFPHATDGAPAPLILGMVRQKGPNTIWYGDFSSVANYKKVKTGILSSTKTFTGYSYYCGFDLGLGLGPSITMKRIWLDKDIVWTGDVGPGETSLSINKPDLFGGKDSGGGFVGTLRFYGGEFSTQPVNAYLVSKLTDVPAYRGISHVVFEKPYIGNAAQLRAPSFELCHYPNTLGLSGGKNKVGDDLNPAEAIYYILVDSWSGCGLNPAKIDVTSFTSAASTLYDEGNGISLVVSAANQAKDIIAECLRQMDGILYEDPATGLLTLKLIRADYNVSSLDTYDETSIIAVKNFTRLMWSETSNECRVTYTDRGSSYESGTAIVQDMANINAQGRIRSQTLSFPGCCVSTLAAQLAARQLSQIGIPLFKAQFEFNRSAINLRPGSVFNFSWADYGIVSAVMRVQKIDLGSLADGHITVDAIQDAFASADVVFAAPPSVITTAPDRTPVAISAGLRLWQEMPYFMMQLQTEVPQPFAAASSWTMGLARAPNSTQQGYSLYVDTSSGFTAPSAEVDRHGYSDTALLHTAVLVSDGRSNGTTNVRVKLADFTLVTTWATGDMRAGNCFFQIGDELFAYTTVTDHGDGTYTLLARRALLDTKFQAHTVDATVFFLTSGAGIGPSTFSDAATLYGKFASFSDKGEYDYTADTAITLAMGDRYDRPLPPDLPLFDGSNAPGTFTGHITPPNTHADPVTVSWRERNRLSSSVAFEDDASETPESGQTYRLEVWKDGVEDASLRQTGISGTSTTITFPAPYISAAGGGEIRIYAQRAGLLSWTSHGFTGMTFSVPNP